VVRVRVRLRREVRKCLRKKANISDSLFLSLFLLCFLLGWHPHCVNTLMILHVAHIYMSTHLHKPRDR
jgi:hypothetical protein